MRLTLLTLVMLVALDSDWALLLSLVAALPVLIVATFLALWLAPAVRRRGQSETGRWHGEHRYQRRPSAPGRHTPARGRRLQGVSRQAQLEEPTVSVDAAAILRGLERPEGQPDIGAHGFWSWDGGTVRGPRPKRPARAPETPPPGA